MLAAGRFGHVAHAAEVGVVTEGDRVDGDVLAGCLASGNDWLAAGVVKTVGHEDHSLHGIAAGAVARECIDAAIDAGANGGAALHRLTAKAGHLVANRLEVEAERDIEIGRIEADAAAAA